MHPSMNNVPNSEGYSKTPSINLKPADIRDAELICGWYAEEDIRKFAILQPFLGYSETEAQELIKGWLNKESRKLYLVLTESKEPIGIVMYEHIDWRNRAAKIGYLVGEPNCRRRGYGLAMLKEVIRLGCYEWGLHRLGANCLSSNTASIKCLQKAGFVQEGVFKEAVIRAGTYQDIVLFGFLGRTNT